MKKSVRHRAVVHVVVPLLLLAVSLHAKEDDTIPLTISSPSGYSVQAGGSVTLLAVYTCEKPVPGFSPENNRYTWTVNGETFPQKVSPEFTFDTPDQIGEITVKCQVINQGHKGNASTPLRLHNVEFESVSDADHIGDDGSRKVYATAQGSGSVTAKLKVTPADAPLIPTSVSWTAGAGASPLERSLSKGALAIEGTTWNADAHSKRVLTSTLHVFKGRPAESPLEIEAIAKRDDANPGVKPLGATHVGAAMDPKELKFEAYYENKTWVFAFTKCVYEIPWGIKPPPDHVNIDTGKESPFPKHPMQAFNSENSCKKQAKLDLTPNLIGKPSCVFYWCMRLTIKHEMFHFTDFRDNWHEPGARLAASDVSEHSVAVTMSTLTPNQAVNQELKILTSFYKLYIDQAIKKHDVECELRAYKDGKEDYLNLVESITLDPNEP